MENLKTPDYDGFEKMQALLPQVVGLLGGEGKSHGQ
jgi:hypothetical protein